MAPEEEAAEGREFRIDELARRAGTTVRNVRAYQDRGLLPSPRRAGRVGLYSEAHLARLRLVGTLLDRGYTLANISELVGAWEQGQDIGDLLGFEAALAAPWSDERPTTVSAAELTEVFGEVGQGDGAVALGEAVRLGILEDEGVGFRVVSPRMLETGALLVRAGVPISAVIELTRRMHEDIDDVAQRFVDLVDDYIFQAAGTPLTSQDIPRLSELVQRLRPLAKLVVEAELSRAMDRHVQARFGDRVAQLARTRPDAAS